VSSFDTLLDDLAESPGERALMEQALRLLAYAPVQVSPPFSLRERVLGEAESAPPVFEAGGSFFARGAGLPWVKIAPGVELKDLHYDAAAGTRTSLIRMEPNRPFPPHHHGFIEDLYVIEGDAWVGDVHMSAGDYCRAPAGTEHDDVRSGEHGTLTLVVSR